MDDAGSGVKLLQDMAEAIGSRSNTIGNDRPELNMLIISLELAEIMRSRSSDQVANIPTYES